MVCTAGPSAGRQFSLVGTEMVIGRARVSGIAIPDPTVSRKHVLLRSSPSGWTAHDLGSGNGTILNGQRILEETALADGDVLRLGDTRLTFIGAQARLRFALVWPGPRWARGAVLLLFVMAALVLVRLKILANEASARREQELRMAQGLAAAFQAGKSLVRQGNWEQALVRFDAMRKAKPDFPAVEEYWKRAKKEVPNQRLLTSARLSLERNQLGAASEALGRVDPDTQLHGQLGALRDLLGRHAALHVADAQRAIDARDYKRALEIAQDVLRAFPDNVDAQTLSRRAKQAVGARGKPAPAATVALWEAATARFRNGDLAGAIEIASQCAAKNMDRCRQLLEEMREVAQLQPRVEELDLKQLDRLLELDQRLAGGKPSKAARRPMAQAAQLYYKGAASAKAAGEWAEAIEFAGRTLQLAPAHPGALSIVNDLKARAKELFVLAYSVKDAAPDEALVRFKEVIAMTSPTDETHLKAVNWVEKLSR